ncbi:hypothetical protein LX99_02587 [Mucilaginibacter oryzae]|uniref:Uncharacterized protein n=1 Tax=Mucilaginibacter oryzae TaxID=468058 RepID=A0A316HBC7_9SPHI|nr:hypothetical protein [Mucilaginibacter oryzae]PWK77707.1 hypothetical protein LX99_02587 [Mucilaginibacter oryzae]
MKNLYLIILCFLVVLNCYGERLSTKLDTGKIVPVSAKKDIPLPLSLLKSISSAPNFESAQLIRTGWSDGIFNSDFYRHDLASANPAGFEELSDSDRRNFIIIINQDAIKQAKDTVCYDDGKLHRCIYTFMQVQLNNRSADTLKYINMSCSWLDAFRADKECIRFLPTALMMECWKNSPTVYMVPPYRQVIFDIPVFYLTDTGDNKPFTFKTIKIGMSLFKYKEGRQLPVDIYSLAHTANYLEQ